MEIGGAETSLIGLLHHLDSKEYKVDLLINDPRGEMIKYIPEWVNIIKAPKAYNYIERPIIETLRAGLLCMVYSRLKAKYKFSQYLKKKKAKDGNAIFGYIGKYVTPALPSLDYLEEYDVAISYVTPHNIVLEKVLAKKKIAWIHTDYSKIDINEDIELPVWEGYDKIVSISPDVTKSFLKIFPSLKDKIIEIENFIPESLIKSRSEEFIPKDMPQKEGMINILTIGRYCQAKRIDEIPVIAKILKEKDRKFRWYIIGYGSKVEECKIKAAIKGNNVEEEVILLGKRENPYPYIRACDMYVQPSRYEGKSITVREAQLLGKPVVITNYPTAQSQIENGRDGLIGPYQTEEFANYLADFFQNNKQ